MTKHFFVNGLTVAVGLLLMVGCAAANSPNFPTASATPTFIQEITVEPIAQVTPQPGEKVIMGTAIEIQPLPPQPYLVRPEVIYGPATGYTRLTVTRTDTQESFQLGEDGVDSYFFGITPKYIIWRGACNKCSGAKTPIYAHDLATGEEKSLATAGREISGDWMTHFVDTGVVNHVGLGVYNIETGEDIPLAKVLPVIDNGTSAETFYAINEDTIAWFEMDFDTRTFTGLWVYDLRTRTQRQLAVSNLNRPKHLSVSNALVVWRDDGRWQGYDLEHDSPFSISIIPPSWANKAVKKSVWVTAMGRYLHWSLANDTETAYFLAPVGLPGEAVAPPVAMPTGTVVANAILPTQIPMETPRAPGYP